MIHTPDEPAVYELTNTGTMQTHKNSPHNVDLNKILTMKSNNSPSSKARKWTNKFAKFQINSDKKKRESPTISSPLQVNTSSLFERSESTHSLNDAYKTPTTEQNHLNEYPFRTSSLPRPTSHLYTPHKMEQPKTAPLGKNPTSSTPSFLSSSGFRNFSENEILAKANSRGLNSGRSASAKSKRSFVRERCTLCNELISNKSNGERIIELECKHLCHEECLSVSMDNMSNTVSSDFHTVFPECSKCLEEKDQVRQCIPKNDDLKDRLLSHILIHKSASSPTTFQTIDTPLQQAYSPLTTPINQIQSQALFQQTPNSVVHNQELFNFPLAEAPVRRRPLNSIPTMNNNGPTQTWKYAGNNSSKEYFNSNNDIRKHSLYLPKLGRVQSNVETDMVSMTTTNTVSLKNQDNNEMPLIRSYFTQILLENFEDILVDWKIDDEFGLLRLVDKLLVSVDNNKFNLCWCLLFANALIIVQAEEPKETSKDNITLDTKLTNLQIFNNINDLDVATEDPSTLKLVYHNLEHSQIKTLYLTESLHSNTSSVIQKWISGLLDHDINFNENNITSTLQMPLILKNMGNDSNNTNTYTSLFNPNRMVELSSFQRGAGSVIIRRSFNVDKSNQTNNPETTLLTMMTSISSILSLKKEKPDDLIVIIQIDHNKLRNDNEYQTIFNSLKALTLLIPTSNLCIVNPNGYVCKITTINDELIDVNSIKYWKEMNGISRLNPQVIKNKLYPSGITSNIGITILSNSNMDENKSCLLMDYSSFSQTGKHTPNELKIKVGYLNVDYSSKINELVELDTWEGLLETLCYSYNFYFGEDNDTTSLYFDRNTLSGQSILQYSDNENSHDNGDNKSIITLQISTPIELSNSIPQSLEITTPDVDHNSSLNIEGLNISNEDLLKDEKTPDELKINILQQKRETYSVVLNQIDEAIQDIKTHNTVEFEHPTEKRESLYNYL